MHDANLGISPHLYCRCTLTCTGKGNKKQEQGDDRRGQRRGRDMARPAGGRRRNQPKQVHDIVSLPRHRASRGRGRAIDENSELQAVCPRLHGGIKKQTRRASSTDASWGNTASVSHRWNTAWQGLMRALRDFGTATEQHPGCANATAVYQQEQAC